jgi:hypothetical protein
MICRSVLVVDADPCSWSQYRTSRPNGARTTGQNAHIRTSGVAVRSQATRVAGAQNARSGLAMLAPEPHRTTRRPPVELSPQPAFRASSATNTYVPFGVDEGPICRSLCAHDIGGLIAGEADRVFDHDKAR